MRSRVCSARALRAIVALAIVALPACGPNRTVPMRDRVDASVAPPLDCVPNLDGRIDAVELAPVLRVPVGYLVNPAGQDREVDLVGTLEGDVRTWDLGSDYATDVVLDVIAQPIDGQWFSGDYPDADFAAPIDVGATLLGVYRHSDTALELLGVVSANSAPAEGMTSLRYETPIALFRFPLEVGDHWVSVGEIRNGTLRGLPYAGRDTYDVSVVAEGTLVLPDLTFDRALRITTAVTVEPAAGMAVSRRQSSFLFECFGEVARATSRDGETSDDFTTAAELRRFGL